MRRCLLRRLVCFPQMDLNRLKRNCRRDQVKSWEKQNLLWWGIVCGLVQFHFGDEIHTLFNGGYMFQNKTEMGFIFYGRTQVIISWSGIITDEFRNCHCGRAHWLLLFNGARSYIPYWTEFQKYYITIGIDSFHPIYSNPIFFQNWFL